MSGYVVTGHISKDIIVIGDDLDPASFAHFHFQSCEGECGLFNHLLPKDIDP